MVTVLLTVLLWALHLVSGVCRHRAGGLRLACLAGVLLAAGVAGPIWADLSPEPVVEVQATPVAQRQERTLPVVEPSPITVTVSNPEPASELRVDSITLAFNVGARSAGAQYLVTAPELPATLSATASLPFLFRVTPRPGATVFETVEVTATVSATYLASSASSTATTATSWTVTPGARVVVGQRDAFSLESLRRGMTGPAGVFRSGSRLFVADCYAHRVLIWNTLPTEDHQPADVVLGQPGTGSTIYNQGGLSASSLYYPFGVCSDGVRLFVTDSNNRRVLIWNTIPTRHGQPADLVLGQADFVTVSSGDTPTRSSIGFPTGVATLENRLFVADSNSNRVLVWDPIPTTSGAPASFVLGQPDFTANGASPISSSSLSYPLGVGSDGTRLFVTDSSNHRVLIWDRVPTVNATPANLVLGQPDFTSAEEPQNS